MMMNPNPRLLMLPLILLLVGLFPVCLCQSNQLYQNCSQTFRCGDREGLGYPFWGGDRPPECGRQGFQLNCGNDDPLITIGSLTYRVLEVNNDSRILRVARDDLWSNLCPETVRDTIIGSNPFDFYQSITNQIFTLYYGCTGVGSTPLPNQFDCNGNTNTLNLYLPGATPLGNGIVCNTNTITVRVNQSTAQALVAPQATGSSLLQEALKYGFWIHWTADEQTCSSCRQSGGYCGQASQGTGAFACLCRDDTHSSTCDGTVGTPAMGGNGKKNNKVALPIGLGIGGAVLAGLVLGWLFFYCRQRRKLRHLPLAAQTPGVLTKEIKSASSGTPLSTASSNFTQSIPSYPSSKSDIGRGSSYFGAKVFEYEELEQATDNFNPSRELGEGGFGTVYHGELPDGTAIAVKRLYENNFRRVEQFMNEVKILTQVRHPNLVILYGCTSRRSRELLLVYEYVPNGTVADHIHGKRSNSGLLSWPVRLNIAIETAEALSYLHKSDIVHRDVKTNNILLCDKFHVKVADFGLSRLFPTDVTHVSTAPQGTPGYVDPEYYQIYQLTEQSDVYSFGVVLMELISSLLAVDINRHRHDINLSTMAINKIQNHALHEMVDPNLGFDTDSNVRRMITQVAELAFRCLQQEREMRPSMDQVLQTLKEIQSDNTNGDHQEEMVDVLVDDDTGPLKGSDAPSP